LNEVMQSEAWMNVGILWSFCNSSGRKFSRKTGNYNICTNKLIRLRRGSNGGFSEISSFVNRGETCRLSKPLLASQG